MDHVMPLIIMAMYGAAIVVALVVKHSRGQTSC